MKKAKIMLAAIAVLTVVGGALAFKAKTLSTGKYWTTNGGTECVTVTIDEFTLRPLEPNGVGSIDVVKPETCTFDINSIVE